MRKELHVWFGHNMRRWDSIDGDLIESYDGLSNACRVSKNNNEQQDDEVIIHTHNVIFANSRVMEEYGFRLFIHPAVGDTFEITFGRCANTNREIQPHHDILKLLLSGEFDTDGCKVISEDFKEDKNMNVTEIKRVKAKDFDSAAFNRKEFRIVIDSPKGVSKTLRFLHNSGYMWGSSKTSLVEDTHMREALLCATKRHPVFIIASFVTPHGILRDIRPSADIPTVELVFEETNNDKIVITNDGKTTTATLYSNGKKAGIGTAICHDDDKFDVYAGARLALERLEKNKKETEMTDWEKFTKGEVDMRVPKKYIQNFLSRAERDSLTFKGMMSDWYLRWLVQDGDSIVVSVDCDIEKTPIVVEVIHGDWGRTVNYIPGMK